MKRILWNTLHSSLRPLSAIGMVAAMALLVSSVVAQPTEPGPPPTVAANESGTQEAMISVSTSGNYRAADGSVRTVIDGVDIGITDETGAPLVLTGGVGARSVATAATGTWNLVAASTDADAPAVADVPASDLPDPIKPGEEVKTVVASVSELQGFAATGQWGLFASGILTLLLVILSTLLFRFEEVRKWLQPYMGYMAMALPMIGCLIAEFALIPAGAGAGDWGAALWAGAQVGGNSIVIYEIVWKKWIRPLARKLWAWIKRKKAEPK